MRAGRLPQTAQPAADRCWTRRWPTPCRTAPVQPGQYRTCSTVNYSPVLCTVHQTRCTKQTVQYSAIPHRTAPHRTVQRNTVPYRTLALARYYKHLIPGLPMGMPTCQPTLGRLCQERSRCARTSVGLLHSRPSLVVLLVAGRKCLPMCCILLAFPLRMSGPLQHSGWEHTTWTWLLDDGHGPRVVIECAVCAGLVLGMSITWCLNAVHRLSHARCTQICLQTLVVGLHHTCPLLEQTACVSS
jgi:hypothetical protein